jgi:hypothetical protein
MPVAGFVEAEDPVAQGRQAEAVEAQPPVAMGSQAACVPHKKQ